jgi:hypothetical protein
MLVDLLGAAHNLNLPRVVLPSFGNEWSQLNER